MQKPSGNTAAGRGKRAAILAWLAESGPARINEAEFVELQTRFSPISERRLREILRSSAIPLDPLVEGIRQDTLEDLERTLLAMFGEYGRSPKAARRAVIQAKDHARLSMRKADDSKRNLKEEMILWMLTWLENPGLFAEWVCLRKRVVGESRPPEEDLY
jgi:hypothetical protein